MPPVLHDNHLMRFLPLIPHHFDPAPWRPFRAAELAWGPEKPAPWRDSGLEIHAIHLQPAPWDERLGEAAMAAMRAGIGPDFLVIPAAVPEGRMEDARFMTTLEGLLELTHGSGVKIALRPRPGDAGALYRRLREVRGEAVGFCWDKGVGPDLDAISDRLFCAAAEAGDDLQALARLGYRWNVAVPCADPAAAAPALAALEAAHPMVYFPEGMADLLPREEK